MKEKIHTFDDKKKPFFVFLVLFSLISRFGRYRHISIMTSTLNIFPEKRVM